MSKFTEFILFNHNYTNTTGDFSGSEEALDTNGRIDFLRAYSHYLDKAYGMRNGSKKVIGEDEIKETLNKVAYEVKPLKRKTLYFDTMTASIRKPLHTYKNWQFYTDRVKLNNGVIEILDQRKFPIPAAKFEYAKKLKKAVFKVKIDVNKHRDKLSYNRCNRSAGNTHLKNINKQQVSGNVYKAADD